MAALLAEKVPGSVLEVIQACGHLVPLERPDETARLVLNFLGALR
jgi:pimeloyl-ACP methyl ester carboxylesterase